MKADLGDNRELNYLSLILISHWNLNSHTPSL